MTSIPFMWTLASPSAAAWREDRAAALVAAARETLALWDTGDGDGMDFTELAADIAHEADRLRRPCPSLIAACGSA